MKYGLLVLLCFISLTSFSQNKKFSDYSFKELLAECKITFKVPRGFREVPVIPDNGHLYQYAIKDSSTGFETRYYIKPYSLFFGNDTTFRKDPKTYNFFVSSLLNVSGYVLPEYPGVDATEREIMKHDFNADYGLSSFFEPKSQFGEGYTYCLAFAMRKDNVGEVYIFMLFTIKNHETNIIVDDILSSIDFN